MEYLSDGITESLINSLSQLPNVRVLARSTMFRFKGKDSDPARWLFRHESASPLINSGRW